MSDQPVLCPRCRTILTPRHEGAWAFEHCSGCGMGFYDRSAQCKACLQPYSRHKPIHPRPPARRLLCPLCGGPRHWKDAKLSHFICSWRQWATATGRLPKDAEPTADLPNQQDSNEVASYMKWMAAHPTLEAGSVPAERIFRQRLRENRSLSGE